MEATDGTVVDQVEGEEKREQHDGKNDGCHFRSGNADDEDTVGWIAFDRTYGRPRQPSKRRKV